MLGFRAETRDVVVGPGSRQRADVRLAEATAELGGLRVEADRDRRWERHRERFERAIIGESANAAGTRLLNPEALSFRLRWGTLRAEADAPLVFENRALGYRLTYDLREFAASAGLASYDGGERFERLEPASPEEAARWAEARARAYRGSLRHLLRALLADTAEEEGFSLQLVREDGSGFGSRWPDRPVSARHVMRTGRGRLGHAPRPGPARGHVPRRAGGAGVPPVGLVPRAAAPAGLRPALGPPRRPRPGPGRPAGDARGPVRDHDVGVPRLRAPGATSLPEDYVPPDAPPAEDP